ncbi:MAG TPA: hypothetical protein VM617_08670 [Thermoanaerobaculia bacterium]|nr:hypothetical protein [Thermoanaerobaculia bacterium]
MSGFPTFEVEYDKRGRLHDREQEDALAGFVADEGPSDLLVLSHGWNNDMTEARALYARLLGHLRAHLDAGAVPGLENRAWGVFAILWPSKRFADRDLIPSGAASAPGVGEGDLEAALDELAGFFDADDADDRLAEARQLVGSLDADPQARRDFVEVLRPLFPDDPDAETAAELPAAALELPGDEVLARLGTPPALPEPAIDDGGGAAVFDPDGGGGGDGESLDPVEAASLGSLFDGVKAGARNFLNLLTYYTMKERARTVGRGGAHRTLRRLRQARPDLRLHLVGHSFGGRLVTAAAAGPDDEEALPVASLTLLQAAFSHYGFAENWDGEGGDGLFRAVLTELRLEGPMLVTHTKNDRAVGLAYPLASRLARQVAAAIGGPDDVYGGIGRNGALKTPEATRGELLAVGGAYAFEDGKVHNLLADPFIADHGAVATPQTAYAILVAAS